MRHFMPNVAALEAEKLETQQREEREAILATPMLSMEEQVNEMADQTMCANEVDRHLEDTQRVLEVSEAIEDLASVIDTIEEADDGHLKLIETVGQAAVAGSDVDPAEIVPAMESQFLGKKIATESMRDTAYAIWTRIQEFVKRIWTKIDEFFYRIFGDVPRLRRTILELENKLKDLTDKRPDGKLDITAGAASLSVNYSPIKNANELKKAFGDIVDNGKYVYEKAAAVTVTRGKIVEAAIKEFDPAQAPAAVASLRAALKTNLYPAFPGSKEDKARYPGFRAFVGEGLMGNVSLVFKHWEEDKDNESDIAALERYANTVLDLVPTSEKKQMPVEAKVEIDVLTMGEMKDLLKDAMSLLDVVEKYKRGSHSKDIDTQRRAIEKASDEAEKKLASYRNSSNADERVCTTQYRALLNFNATYAKWGAKPFVPYTAYALKELRAVLVVIQKSMSAYMAPGEKTKAAVSAAMQ